MKRQSGRPIGSTAACGVENMAEVATPNSSRAIAPPAGNSTLATQPRLGQREQAEHADQQPARGGDEHPVQGKPAGRFEESSHAGDQPRLRALAAGAAPLGW